MTSEKFVPQSIFASGGSVDSHFIIFHFSVRCSLLFFNLKFHFFMPLLTQNDDSGDVEKTEHKKV